jgi:hypothetical protein
VARAGLRTSGFVKRQTRAPHTKLHLHCGAFQIALTELEVVRENFLEPKTRRPTEAYPINQFSFIIFDADEKSK